MVTIRITSVVFLFTFLLVFAGCNDEKKDAYDKAYKANYDRAYQEGLLVGEERGKKEGEERGTAAAYKAAETGLEWRLYLRLALSSLAGGFVVGLFIQYGVLLICRRSERLPQLWTVAFVPAMKQSFSYSIFERRRRSMVEIDEELREIGARKRLQVTQIQAARDAVAQKIKALSSIEELSRARLIELANEELSKIVLASTEKANQIKDGQSLVSTEQVNQIKSSQSFGETRLLITYTCPICQKLVRYKEQIANKTVKCPNKECGQPITLPPMLLDGDGAPLIIDVSEE